METHNVVHLTLSLILLITFPLLTTGKCILSSDKLSCKETNTNNFWKEFYEKTCDDDIHSRNITINIEDSYFNVIEYFPDLPSIENRFHLTSLTVKNSSVERVNERALQELCRLEKLDLSRNMLRNISFISNLPKSLRYLYLSENNIAYVDNFFKQLVNLVLLDLSRNKIRVIDFNNVFWVSELNFSSNIVDTLIPASEEFKTKIIDLSCNKIKYFNESELNGYTTYLDVSNNELFSIELTYEKNVLNLSGNTNFTEFVGECDFLYINHLDLSATSYLLTSKLNLQIIIDSLSISNSQIPVLDNSLIAKLYFYENVTIDLSNSSITDITAHSFKSIRISALNLSRNNIKRLKNNVFSDSTITTLNLSYSNIKYIEKYAFDDLESTTIILKGNKLSNVENIFNKIQVHTLDLSFNPINTISNRSFDNFYKLSTLNFSNCGIERLEKDAFFGLVDLKTLDLSYNKLYILETNTFNNLAVENLIFFGSKIDTVQEKAFNNLHNLKELNLSGVGLKSLASYSFYNLSSTQVVYLRNNNIPTIPCNLFHEMDKLRNVYLDGNNITTINPFSYRIRVEFLSLSFNGIFKFEDTLNLNLKYLIIKDSKIHRLKDNSFSGYYNLIKLSFENSYVGFVEDKALRNLFNLQFLDSQSLFKYTKVVKQNMFKDLKSLTFLNVSHLSLEELETKSFMGLKKLDTLLLNNNNFTQLLEDTFYGLINLRELDLSHCKIASLSEKTFRGLGNLKTLYLNFNNILEIGAGVFEDLSNLVILHLENNNISFVNTESFMGLKSIEKLYLQGNSIHDLSVGIFKHLPTLKLLNISNNNIKLLKPGSFSNLGSLEYLDLSENKLDNLNNIDIFFSMKYLQALKIDGNNLKQFDFTRLLKNLKKLRYAGISRNKWKCDTLSLMIEELNNRNISYKPNVPVYDDDNIDGVGCLDICKFVYCLSENLEQTIHY